MYFEARPVRIAAKRDVKEIRVRNILKWRMNAEQFTEMNIWTEGGQFGGKGSGIKNLFILPSKEKKGNILLFNFKKIIILKKMDERIFLTLWRERSPSQNNISISAPSE